MSDLGKVLERIERRLSALSISADAASKAAGKPDAIRNMRRAVKSKSRKSANVDTISALAPVLRTTTPWLLVASGPEDTQLDQQFIPVWGIAGAGGEIYRFHESDGPIDEIAAPDGANESTSAVEIRGESLGRIFDGWYAIYDEVRTPPTADLLGRLCVVELTDGRVFIKRLKKGRGRKFILESNVDLPIYDVAVKWAARVRTLIPR